MTAVYAPLQNASATQRGAVTTAAQEIAGPKHFLDPLTAEELVAQWLELQNDYTENFTVEAAPFTATGVPVSVGGPTTEAAPFWGLRAQSVPIGGDVGTITTLALGLFPGASPADLIGIDTVANVDPGLVLGTTANGSYAALIATSAALGLTAAATAAALEFDEGTGYLRAPLSLDHDDAVLRSGARAFRWNSGSATVAELRHGGNTVLPTFGTGVEMQLATSGPGAFTRWQGGGFADGVVLGPIMDGLLALTAGVHMVAPQGLDRIATFGVFDAGDYASAARIHYTGAYEVDRVAMGPADGGVLLGSGGLGEQMQFTLDASSGVIASPLTDQVESITIVSPAILSTSIPRVQIVGEPSGASSVIAVIESVAAGQFVMSFREAGSPGTATFLGPGGSGTVRWEVAR